MKDGDLRHIFRDKLRSYQWTSVETAGTASGVPDSEFCSPFGVQGWIEFKQTKIFHVSFRPFQVAWLMRRYRNGGNAWIAVRRIPSAKKYNGADELWFMRADQAQALYEGGLESVSAWMWEGGPSNWNFQEIDNLFHTTIILG
jgi:hypothetical protein